MIIVELKGEVKAAKAQEKEILIEWEKNITVLDVFEKLEIEKSNVGLIIVNNLPVKYTDELDDNCKIIVLPILCGG